MPHDERAMLLFAQLAGVSQSKGQKLERDRFLMLTGIAATRAGWPEVAARCRELIVAHSPRHLIGRHQTFADALRDAEFAPFVHQCERFCTTERAELLLSQMGLPQPADAAPHTAGERALSFLSGE